MAVPVYDEREIVPELTRRLIQVLDELPGGPHEVVFVDDGSTDGTLECLETEATEDTRIRVVSLSRNFGHQIAISAALDHVSGDVTVIMDGDLQDPPEVIPELVARYRSGYDVVYARRKDRSEPLLLRTAYLVFYRIVSRISTIDLPLDAGDFGLMSRRVVELIRNMPERNRYLRGLRAWTGFRQAGIDVPRSGRPAGESKYSSTRLFRLAFDGIFAFSTIPLRLATAIGLGGVLLSSLYALYSLVAKFALNQSPRGFTALVFLLTFIFGIQLIFLGVIGEYIGRIYEEAKSRPLYVVKKIVQRD